MAHRPTHHEQIVAILQEHQGGVIAKEITLAGSPR
jgi:hypothetical protein